jgi:hypothetical protein
MAIHSPVSVPSAAAVWEAIPRQVAGSKYSAAAELTGMAMGESPPGSGRRARGVAKFSVLSVFGRWQSPATMLGDPARPGRACGLASVGRSLPFLCQPQARMVNQHRQD